MPNRTAEVGNPRSFTLGAPWDLEVGCSLGIESWESLGNWALRSWELTESLPPVLDVDREDFTIAAAALHRLALALLEEVFDIGAGLTHERWFGAADVAVFDRVPAVRLGWRRSVARFVPALRSLLAGKGRWFGSGAAAPGRLRWSEGAVRARLAIEYHGADGLRIPDQLLALAGHSAWEAPEFRLAAATLVTDHLRTRLIVPPDGLPAARVVPAVVWMLIATSRVRVPLAARLGLAYRRERRALERLRRFARTAIEDAALPGDFWSHWIAWHVERRFGVSSDLPPEWLSPLRSMDGSPDPAGRPAPGGSSLRWQSPDALAAAYAAWYPAARHAARPNR